MSDIEECAREERLFNTIKQADTECEINCDKFKMFPDRSVIPIIRHVKSPFYILTHIGRYTHLRLKNFDEIENFDRFSTSSKFQLTDPDIYGDLMNFIYDLVVEISSRDLFWEFYNFYLDLTHTYISPVYDLYMLIRYVCFGILKPLYPVVIHIDKQFARKINSLIENLSSIDDEIYLWITYGEFYLDYPYEYHEMISNGYDTFVRNRENHYVALTMRTYAEDCIIRYILRLLKLYQNNEEDAEDNKEFKDHFKLQHIRHPSNKKIKKLESKAISLADDVRDNYRRLGNHIDTSNYFNDLMERLDDSS